MTSLDAINVDFSDHAGEPENTIYALQTENTSREFDRVEVRRVLDLVRI